VILEYKVLNIESLTFHQWYLPFQALNPVNHLLVLLGSPDWTMLITNSLCLTDYTEWLPGQDFVRTFSKNTVDEIEIPIYDIPAHCKQK